MQVKPVNTLLPLIPLLLSPSLLAQESEYQAEIETMHISASRSNVELHNSPQVVTVISREQIEEQLSITTDSSQILSNLLPAYTPSRQKLTGSGETFRGRVPLFMIDGVPQSNPLRQTGRSAHSVDLALIERIEVIHGANAIHGLGATGGIINFITRRPDSGSINQSFNIQATSPTSELNSDSSGYKLSYGVNGNSGDFDYLLGMSYEDQGIYIDANGDPVGVDNVQGDLMDSEAYDVLAKLGYWIDDSQKVEFQVNRYVAEGKQNYVSIIGDRENGIVSSSQKGTPEGMAASNKVLTISTSYQNDDLYGTELMVQAYHQQFNGLFGATQSKTFQDPDIAPVGTLYDQSELQSSKMGIKTTLLKEGLFDQRFNITTGFDLLQDRTEQSLAITNRSWVPETKLINYAAFVQTELSLLSNLVLHSGIRYEFAEFNIDDFQTLASKNSTKVAGGDPSFEEPLFNVGLVFHPVETVRIFANYSEGFGMPDIGRVLRGIKIPGQDIDTMLDVQPIVTNNTEVGIRFNNNTVDLEFSYYRSSADFGSRLVNVDDHYVLNREENEISGFEAIAGYQLTEQHKVKLAYSYIEGEYDSNADGSLDKKLSGANISPNRLIASWTSHWSDNVSSFLQINHAFDRSFEAPENEFTGYSLVDASVGYKLPYGKVNLAAANLLNTDYITYYSQSATTKDDRYFKGRGRTVTLGYSMDF